MTRAAALLVLALAACGTPGTDVSRQRGDFALVETLLQG
jgi:hypothetical protein